MSSGRGSGSKRKAVSHSQEHDDERTQTSRGKSRVTQATLYREIGDLQQDLRNFIVDDLSPGSGYHFDLLKFAGKWNVKSNRFDELIKQLLELTESNTARSGDDTTEASAAFPSLVHPDDTVVSKDSNLRNLSAEVATFHVKRIRARFSRLLASAKLYIYRIRSEKDLETRTKLPDGSIYGASGRIACTKIVYNQCLKYHNEERRYIKEETRVAMACYIERTNLSKHCGSEERAKALVAERWNEVIHMSEEQRSDVLAKSESLLRGAEASVGYLESGEKETILMQSKLINEPYLSRLLVKRYPVIENYADEMKQLEVLFKQGRIKRAGGNSGEVSANSNTSSGRLT
jgi:hypothetical protein